MKNFIFIIIASLFLLSCSQNEELLITSENKLNQKSNSKLATGQNVKLIQAKDSRTISCSRGGCKTVQTRQYIVEVVNLDFNKVVTIHQQLNNGQWEDVSLTYSFTTTTGTEIWKGVSIKDLSLFTYPAPSLFGERLSAKYAVKGQIYWDNNSSSDYVIINSNRQDNSSSMYLHNDFNIMDTTPYNEPSLVSDTTLSYLSIAADIRNIAFAKEVNVVYTTNNWATSQTKSLLFNSYESNNATRDFERWTASFAIPKTTSVTYALCYTVNGQTYWDNNFGKNYMILSN
jgi:Carbohydrate/starch-binding module (family 21)